MTDLGAALFIIAVIVIFALIRISMNGKRDGPIDWSD